MKQWVFLGAGMLLGSFLTYCADTALSSTHSVQDPVKQSPRYYTVLLENDEVRVLEYRLGPGEKEPMHSHSAGVVYGFSDSKIRSTLPDGTTTESAGKAGDVFWRNPVTHALENIGHTEVHSLAIELKRPSNR
jgi:quercetin dioxygenase-like cupin family protein